MPTSSVSRPLESPLLERAGQLIRTRHMPIRTENAYPRWIVQGFRFQRQRRGEWVHPFDLRTDDINRFRTHLAA